MWRLLDFRLVSHSPDLRLCNFCASRSRHGLPVAFRPSCQCTTWVTCFLLYNSQLDLPSVAVAMSNTSASAVPVFDNTGRSHYLECFRRVPTIPSPVPLLFVKRIDCTSRSMPPTCVRTSLCLLRLSPPMVDHHTCT